MKGATMKLRWLVLVGLCAGLLSAFGVSADEQAEGGKKEFKAVCPVSGQAAKEESCIEYKGKKVYFCCENCPNTFKEDPKKYAAQVGYQWLATGQIVQVACPLTGRPINPKATCDINGVAVAFCCMNCQGKCSKSNDPVALVFASLEKGFTLQTECPVSGKKIDITKSVEHKGKNVYFCCGNCPAAFKKEPEKYLDKLPQFAEEEN